MPTPVQSSNLNLIENLWDHLDFEVREHEISSKCRLKQQVLIEEWEKVTSEYTSTLVALIPNIFMKKINNNEKNFAINLSEHVKGLVIDIMKF